VVFGCRDEFVSGKGVEVGLGVVVGVDEEDEGPLLPGGRATFLKVIVHLSSSPAKTTCSCQRTKTRMLLLLPLAEELPGCIFQILVGEKK